jgi:hypothetical protein
VLDCVFGGDCKLFSHRTTDLRVDLVAVTQLPRPKYECVQVTLCDCDEAHSVSAASPSSHEISAVGEGRSQHDTPCHAAAHDSGAGFPPAARCFRLGERSIAYFHLPVIVVISSLSPS